MTFARPWMLLFLAIPILLGLWEWWRRGLRVRLPFDFGTQTHRSKLEAIVKLAAMLPPLALAVAIFFLAGPQQSRIPPQEKELQNILFCLDLSGSMMASFGSGQRSDEALRAIESFCNFRKEAAFGLTVFGNEVIHWVPVTRDLSAIRLAVPMLKPDKMPGWFGGTMIGKALRAVIKRLTSVETGDRMIILISDGESYDLSGGAAEQIGAELASEKIALFYIHMAEGSPQQEVNTMCVLSGGESFVAGDPQALKAVFARIDSMTPAKLKPATAEQVDFFPPWSIAGLSVLGLYVMTLFGLRFVPW